MAKFFSSDNWIWKPFDYAADVLILSGMWFLCSVPVITMGAATTTLYDCTARCVRGHDKAMFARFFRTFKREFLPSLMSLLLWALMIAGGYQLIRLYGNSVPVSDTSTMVTVGLLFLLTIVIGIFSWVLPLLSRFTFSFGQLQITAIKLAFANLPRTILLGVLTVLGGYLCIQLWVPFLVVPEILMILWSLLMEPVFQKYMPPEAS